LPKHVAGLPPPSPPFTVTILEWLLTDPLPLSYQSYATHVVVADEHYFSTMLSHSPFCRDLVAVPSLSPPLHVSPQINLDVNFLQFAQWELGNPAKCLQPDPKRCGRSPANLSPLFFPAVMVSLSSHLLPSFDNMSVQMSDAFFARKFNPLDEERSDFFSSSSLPHSSLVTA
jgi:hypothetical protein